jgi:hypothetical protein
MLSVAVQVTGERLRRERTWSLRAELPSGSYFFSVGGSLAFSPSPTPLSAPL